jgi:HPt (histidine-containing phosphotransfer) domain-containing protein
MSNSEPINIEVDDPIVLELLPAYIKHRRLEIFQLQRLVNQNDFDKIRIIGHNLKGSGGLYGMPQVSEYGAMLESRSLAQDTDDLLKVLKEMESFLERINLPS